MDIILASASPRRKQLLEQMGIRDFRIITADVDETLQPGLSPARQVELLSEKKAAAVRGQVGPESIIIAADTVVALGDMILGKPANEAQARIMLTALSGACHQVYTGFTVSQGTHQITAHEMTDVVFRPLSEQEISNYIATGECLDKAGAYGIQTRGALLVDKICGDYYNVMGLPISHLAKILCQFGVDCLALCADKERLD